MGANNIKNLKIIIFGAAVLFIAFFNSVLAQEKEEKMNLPFESPYDDIESYDYPYLIPPPKMFSMGNLGMYQEEQDNEPKLFYVVKPNEPNIYWKERTYDAYTGQGWLIQNIDTRDKEKNIKSAKTPLRFDIYKFLKKGNYSLDLIIPFTNQSSIDKDSFEIIPDQKFDLLPNVYGDNVFTIGVENDTNIKYQADYYPPDFDIKESGELKDTPKEVTEAYTKLPEKFPQKLKDIAKDLEKNSNGVLSEQILNTYKFVQDNVEYDLKWGSGKTIPKDYDMALWTYENKKGICAHFATLFITLARAQGIPSRLAVGFAGGKVVDDNVYIYSSYAHGWTEIYLPNYGWVPIDPTKGARGEDGQQEEAQESPPEWSNGGNVRPDLKFTLDDQLQKEKDKSQQNGSGSDGGQGGQGGQGGSGGSGNGGGGSGGNSGFDGDSGNLSNLDKWFGNDDFRKLEEKYENWLKEQKNLDDNAIGENGDKNDNGNGDGGNNGENGEDKNGEDKIAEKDKGIINDLKQAVSNIGKNYAKNGLIIVVLTAIFLTTYFIYKKRVKSEGIERKIKERIMSVNKFIDIIEVIRKVELFYEKKEYHKAIIYGYNKLEDYIAYVFDIINDPALTAREFEDLVKKVSLLKTLNIIIENFERAKYSSVDSKEDCSVFLSALREIAASNKTKK